MVVDGSLGALPAVNLNEVKELKDLQHNNNGLLQISESGTLSLAGILGIAPLFPMERRRFQSHYHFTSAVSLWN